MKMKMEGDVMEERWTVSEAATSVTKNISNHFSFPLKDKAEKIDSWRFVVRRRGGDSRLLNATEFNAWPSKIRRIGKQMKENKKWRT